MKEPIKLELEIDIEALKDVIEKATTLEDSEEVFNALSEVYKAKQQVTDILDQLISIESETKGLIKAKADNLYGKGWTSIKGKDYKISQSFSGSIFSAIDGEEIKRKFLVIKESLDSKAVNEYIKEKGELPKGIEYNPNRNSYIKVVING